MRIIKFFAWYGGKIRMIQELKFLISKHVEFYEPFMGSAAFTLNHARSKKEVINDLDEDVARLMRIMADRKSGLELTQLLCELPYSKELFQEAKAAKNKKYEGLTEIEKAVMEYVLITQSFNNTRQSFRKGVSTHKYQKDNRFHLPKVYERLQGVEVLNMDGIELLEQIKDNADAFALVDPPYREELRGAKRVYACELSKEDHIRLLKTIQQAKCKIILCGYRQSDGVDLYDRYLLPYGWHCYNLKKIVKACQTKEKKDIAEEYVWTNYELPSQAKYVVSMNEYRSF